MKYTGKNPNGLNQISQSLLSLDVNGVEQITVSTDSVDINTELSVEAGISATSYTGSIFSGSDIITSNITADNIDTDTIDANTIDVDNIDFVANQEDLGYIIDRIDSQINGLF